MNERMKNLIANKLIGGEDGGNSFVASILSSFGITPDAIKEYALTIKNIIDTKLSSIDVRLSEIQATQAEIIERLQVLEIGAVELKSEIGLHQSNLVSPVYDDAI